SQAHVRVTRSGCMGRVGRVPMSTVQPEDGRVGDVWRIRGRDHEMIVERMTESTITLNTYPQRTDSGWGYDRNSWIDVLYRVREDLQGVQVGDVIHVYVPET